MFKGGTLLRMCYQNEYRYSEDLDFDWIYQDGSKESIRDFFNDVARKTKLRYKTRISTNWGAQKLHLAWESQEGRTGVIDTDVKQRNFCGVEPVTTSWPILGRHEGIDISNPILGYSIESVLAAKFDCIANQERLAPRDYYDLFHLLQDQNIRVDESIREFARRYELRDSYIGANVDWFETIFTGAFQNMDELTERWNVLLDSGMIPGPHEEFETVLEMITSTAQTPIMSYSKARTEEEAARGAAPAEEAARQKAEQKSLELANTPADTTGTCNDWMPQARTTCILPANHAGGCRSSLI